MIYIFLASRIFINMSNEFKSETVPTYDKSFLYTLKVNMYFYIPVVLEDQ